MEREELERIRSSRNEKNPFGRRLGIWIEELSEGYARVTKMVAEDDLNPIGFAHGGIYFSVADTAAGSAMASHGWAAVTVEASYHFLRSAEIGEIITGEAREIKPGRTLSVFDVRLTGTDGVLLGTGTFTFYRLDKRLEY